MSDHDLLNEKQLDQLSSSGFPRYFCAISSKPVDERWQMHTIGWLYYNTQVFTGIQTRNNENLVSASTFRRKS